jgi:2-polyprenyl-3-methyl-5-hydroxy-6-metoxy-1,4-benzoquinol methylase
MTGKDHWDAVYSSKRTNSVSWFEEHAEVSLRLIRATGVPADGSIIDVGGGASTLVDDLLADGFRNLTVLDLSGAALVAAQRRLGSLAAAVCWREADITQTALPTHAYDVWHDRAVFHFLTRPEARAAYVDNMRRSLKPGGHVVIATFGPQGPKRCSGLPVCRYDAAMLSKELGGGFALVESLLNVHQTPAGASQQFLYCRFRRRLPGTQAPN